MTGKQFIVLAKKLAIGHPEAERKRGACTTSGFSG
jgi:hypothetical protein